MYRSSRLTESRQPDAEEEVGVLQPPTPPAARWLKITLN